MSLKTMFKWRKICFIEPRVKLIQFNSALSIWPIQDIVISVNFKAYEEVLINQSVNFIVNFIVPMAKKKTSL